MEDASRATGHPPDRKLTVEIDLADELGSDSIVHFGIRRAGSRDRGPGMAWG